MSRKKAPSVLLKALRGQFELRGWKFEESRSRLLLMVQRPDSIELKLLLDDQLFRPPELPDDGLLAVTCRANIYYRDLEEFIAAVLQYDLNTFGRLTTHLSLGRLVPKGTYFLDQACLIDPREGLEAGVQAFLSDYEKYLEPILKRMSDIDVFADHGYLPPYVSPWLWNIRRAVYLHLRGERSVAPKYLDRVEEEAACELSELPPNNEQERTKLFTDIASLLRSSNRKDAERTQRESAALRTAIQSYLQ
jgi:hypothetical protein